MKVTVLTVWGAASASSKSSIHTTPQKALEKLADWVEEMWDQELLGRSIDDDSFQDDFARVEYFFEKLDNAYQYGFEEKHVYGSEGGWEPPLGPDEVQLSPEEVRATILAIECANIHEMAEGLGTDPDRARDLAHGVTRKLRA